MDALSPAMQRYLRERVSDAGADAPWLLPPRWHIKLYQGLGDSRSALAMCEDLLHLAEQDEGRADTGLLAVFECTGGPSGQDFAACLARHLRLMHKLDARLSAAAPDEAGKDELQMQVMNREFRLIAMHADAERLSRVLPCPVLAFAAL